MRICLLVTLVLFTSTMSSNSALAQRRRLQDLQVTIEPRFITVGENFFDRIGVDFGDTPPGNVPPPSNVIRLNIDAIRITGGPFEDVYDSGVGESVSFCVPLGDGAGRVTPFVGFGAEHQQWNARAVNFNGPGTNFVPDGDLDVVGGFVQGGFEIALPTFGGFDSGGSQVGFAILSDIETFFFIQAATGAGQVNQDLRASGFNPAQPIVTLQTNAPNQSAAYVNGRFLAGLGVSNGAVSLSGVITYQLLGTKLILDDWRTNQSVGIGLEFAVTTDVLFNRRN